MRSGREDLRAFEEVSRREEASSVYSTIRKLRGGYVLWSDLRQLLCLLARWWVFHPPPRHEEVIPYPQCPGLPSVATMVDEESVE